MADDYLESPTPEHDLEVIRIALEQLKYETRFEALGRIALEAFNRLRETVPRSKQS